MLDHGSQSEADYELCRLLGFWCGGDPVRVEAIARASRAYRPKWDERRGDRSWLALTTRQALAGLTRVYIAGSPPTSKTQDCADKSVSPPPSAAPGDTDRLLAHIRSLRLRHKRPVALSIRQAQEEIRVSRATVAR